MSERFRNRYRIESNRLGAWDYSSPGAYFITICTDGRRHYFGEIVANKLIETEAARIVRECWLDLPNHYSGVELDEFVVMPNHVHFIVVIKRGARRVVTGGTKRTARRRMLISRIVGRLKMQTAKRVNLHKGTPGRSFWQKNYYDHIIRSEDELRRIRRYIRENPRSWKEDRNNLRGGDVGG